MAVDSVNRHQFVVVPLFGDSFILQYDNLIGVSDRGKPVRDHDRCPACHETFQRLLNQLLCLGVH